MKDNNKISNFILNIKNNYNAAKSVSIQNPEVCAGSIRAALEAAVKLFWLKKYDKEPVWIDKQGKEEFNLFEAVKDERFSSCFKKIYISDMHLIRQTCNDVLHGQADLDVGTAQELLNRLEKCIEAIQNVIDVKVLGVREEIPLDNMKNAEEIKTTNNDDVSISAPKAKKTVFAPTHAEIERKNFWKIVNSILKEKGNPFYVSSREHYATINRKSPNSNLCLSWDFLIQKGFVRIGIYIQDDIRTPHFDRLFAMREEIEKGLGFKPIWNRVGVRNPNTRRIEVKLPFKVFDYCDYGRVIEDYVRVIEEALPITMQYIKIFSIYLPEIFQENEAKRKNETMLTINNVLTSDIHKNYGGKAQVIYDEGTRVFGWDSSKSYLFGPQQILFASGATREGYSPWFLAHNNWTETKGGNFYNEIIWSADRKEYIIRERYDDMRKGFIDDNTIRVTFAKNKEKKYVFLGLYRPESIKGNIKTYVLVSNTYPQTQSEWVFRTK